MGHGEVREPGIPALPASLTTRHESHAAFDANAKAWDEYTNTPLGRLRQTLTMRHLVQYLGSLAPGLRVLDVGGGTGSYALPLARMGYQVCLLDFSAQMLDIARQKARRLGAPLMERMDFCHASVQDVPGLFPPDHFDLILCHTLLAYVSAPREILRALSVVLQPGGLLSLLFANPYADPLRWALAKQDLERARLTLREQVSSADLFGLPRRTFTAEAMQAAMAQVGVQVVAAYGVRIFADYVPAEKLADPAFYARLLELETAAATLVPYRLIARYNQLLGKKSETAQDVSS
jgi:S-adenosylmethionine-dependent methyltransferase